MSRHALRAPRARSRPFMIGAAAVAVAVTVGAGAVLANGGIGSSNGSCRPNEYVRVAATPELLPVMVKAYEEPIRVDKSCVKVSVASVESSSFIQRDGSLAERERYDAWLPDSSLWLSRPFKYELENFGSVVNTPVVIGTSRQAADALQWTSTPPAWADIITSGHPVSAQDVRVDSEGVAVLAAIRHSLGNTEEAQAGVVKAYLAARKGQVPSASEALERAASNAPDAPLLPISEREVLRVNKSRPESRLTSVYPTGGSPMMDYPFVKLGKADANRTKFLKAAYQKLREEQVQEQFRREGFRLTSSDKPNNGGMGLDRDSTAELMLLLEKLAKPSKILTVWEATKSMRQPIKPGGQSKARVTQNAALTAMNKLPADAKLGLWSFGYRLDGDKDYKELAPPAQLTTKINGGEMTQRDGMTKVIESLEKSSRSPYAGLYDSIDAAYTSMLENYEDEYVSSIAVYTDGVNDDPNSQSREQLVERIKKLKAENPGTKVQLVLIGFGDVNRAEFDSLAADLGGRSYYADSELSLLGVLVDVLKNRGD